MMLENAWCNSIEKRPVTMSKNKKIILFFNDEFRGKTILEFVGLRATTCSYLMDDGSEYKKAKERKKCVIKWRLMFKIYKGCNFSNETIIKSQERFKSDYHNVYTAQINKIALNKNDGRR